jgi:lipopolysaccharide transport system ATP-binding protein
MTGTAIRVCDLEKRYRVWTHAPPTNLKERIRIGAASLLARAHLGERESFRQDVWALRGVSFDVPRGEVLGVIGPNGAGKSTLLAILARITEPTGGHAEIQGRVSSLLEVGTGFHPELSGRDNVFLNGAILGMSRAETRRKFDEIVEFSGVRDFLDIPVKRYSTGMHVRLAFAVAAHLDPEILLLDEVLAVGDAAFQAKCHTRVEEIARSGRTVLFVSHDVGSVARLCRDAIVLRNGRISFHGPADKAVEHYLIGTSEPAYREPPSSSPSTRVILEGVTIRSVGDLVTVRAGAPFSIVVELEALEATRLSELRIELAICFPAGPQLALLSTDLDGGSWIGSETILGRAALNCDVEGLPLRPGNYVVAATLYQHGEIVHRIDRAADLAVVTGPFFGSGAVPSSYPAPVIVRHSWTICEPSPKPSGTRPVDEVTSRAAW